MSYVIYHKETTKIVLPRNRNWYSPAYETEGAAKAALTRAIRKPKKALIISSQVEFYVIAELKEFQEKIEKKEIRHGIVHSEGKEFEVSVNTPWTSGPWSETYWSS